ncbi:MAG TPA: Mur ligase family protein [Vicinamibacterales bacterium]|nr:Mur ligase family protein [Vicinamibacterales bacterium]
MLLSELAAGYEIRGTSNPDISGISEDSRRIGPGMLFVAVRGTAEDGHHYIADALARGAAAIAAEALPPSPDVPVVRLKASRAALADFASRFAGHPARDLTLIGFTGTFGKTSTSAILQGLLAAGGARVAVLGSLGARYRDFSVPGSGLTTPAPVELHRALRDLKDAGADTVIVEVTSHALRLERVAGLMFSGGLLSAIMPGEHSDFHGSYDEYVAAKRLFLNHLSPGATLAFDADNHAARTLARDAAVAVRAGVSLHGRTTDVRLMHVGLDHTGARFTINGRRLHSPLLGQGHLKNVALALTYAFAAGVTIDQARTVLRRLKPLRRRMETYTVGGRLVLDDTAGHPDSLQATFDVAAMLARSPAVRADGRVAVVYAIRGSRGDDINHRNATALADLAAEHGVSRLILTASADAAGPNDRATADEVAAARRALAARYQKFDWFDDLEGAVLEAIAATSPGDLIVLAGAQGMNEAASFLSAADAVERTGSTYRS